VSCTSATLIAVACRPSSPAFHETAAIEQRDRALRADLEQIERSQGPHFADVDWDAGPEPLESLAAAVSEHPVAIAGRSSLRMLSVGEPRSSYGQVVRRNLGESTDDVLLTAAGWFLARAGGWRLGIDFDPRFWAESCFKRALQINPDGVLAHPAQETSCSSPLRVLRFLR
jgi:hypothetical protein